MGFIKLSSVMATTGIIVTIDSDSKQIVSEIIEFSDVLNADNTMNSISYKPIDVVFREVKKYFSANFDALNYEIVEVNYRINW